MGPELLLMASLAQAEEPTLPKEPTTAEYRAVRDAVHAQLAQTSGPRVSTLKPSQEYTNLMVVTAYETPEEAGDPKTWTYEVSLAAKILTIDQSLDPVSNEGPGCYDPVLDEWDKLDSKNPARFIAPGAEWTFTGEKQGNALQVKLDDGRVLWIYDELPSACFVTTDVGDKYIHQDGEFLLCSPNFSN